MPPIDLDKNKSSMIDLPKPPKLIKNVTLPESMRILQERFLTEHNIDAFLSMQDEEVLEFFHQNYDKTHNQIRIKVDSKFEEEKSPADDKADGQQITEKPIVDQEIVEEENPEVEKSKIVQ